MSGVMLIMNWDVKEGKDSDYFEFIVREWATQTNRLGLRMIGLWLSIYSRDDEEPRIRAEALTDDVDTMRRILRSPEWSRMQDRLMDYVENYTQKVVYTDGDWKL
ncbi:hypothetical protein G4Y79_03325 [Phototrophicus methaneseepsis]|uniref:NIPSNAP domain-containing protein n=1 Tax=Phototrophicus methaneseepsis TaxID=2710758 RepID=A0A7S8IFC3_9CHLR|nr:hypothetical protein [Phototrophicus methaneseepsis]QPC83427.1 hypothetical protein G4Y79_03325 [Phototrophicus methaneseepsis]